MLCDECRKRPATVHITKLVGGQKTERNLCEECARGQQQPWPFNQPDFSIHHLLTGMLDLDPLGVSHGRRLDQQQRCSQCGLTYQEFARTGNLGCNQCYGQFQEQLRPLLRRLHGSGSHSGKVPRRTGGTIRTRQELEALRQKLRELVSKEEFELAVQVRDQIRTLEQQLDQRG